MFFSSHTFILWLKAYALHVPLGWFVFSGSFLEEVISPIPAMLITGMAGSVALMRHDVWWQIALLALFASLGKTLGAWIYYVIGDKAEDLLIGRVGKWFGVTHADVEHVGRRFSKHHALDGGALFAARAIPFMPTTPFSLAAGIFKMDIRVYLGITMFGYFIKDMGYILVGYFGLARISVLWRDIDHVKSVVDIIVAVLIIALLYLVYRHQGRAWQWLQQYFSSTKSQ